MTAFLWLLDYTIQLRNGLLLNYFTFTDMGGMFTPGLSGGEKKRASIACELICDPDIIFLDVSRF